MPHPSDGGRCPHVDFTAQHIVVGHVHGRFTQLTGQITVAEDLTQSAVSVSIAAGSIDTHIARRDEDLRSARYLDVDTYPTITFTSKGLVEYAGDQWGMVGDLMIKDITHQVELLTQFTGSAIDDFGNSKVAFLAHAKVSNTGMVQYQETVGEESIRKEQIDVDVSPSNRKHSRGNRARRPCSLSERDLGDAVARQPGRPVSG